MTPPWGVTFLLLLFFLPLHIRNSIMNLWKEFEDKHSEEAKIVYFLDKLEACIQHNESNISTWTEKEIENIENYFEEIDEFDDFIRSFKETVRNETLNILRTKKNISILYFFSENFFINSWWYFISTIFLLNNFF